MVGPTPEDFFQSALDCESRPETLPEAIENYQRVVDLAPNWIEAHINLGVAYYQMGQLTDARNCFLAAVQIDPLNGISRYNLGCTLEELGELDEAVEHLRRACIVRHARSRGHTFISIWRSPTKNAVNAKLPTEQWALYLRYTLNGPWADQARERMQRSSGKRKRSAPHSPSAGPAECVGTIERDS